MGVEIHACGLSLGAPTWHSMQESSKMMLLVKLSFVSRRLAFNDENARVSAGKRAVDGK